MQREKVASQVLFSGYNAPQYNAHQPGIGALSAPDRKDEPIFMYKDRFDDAALSVMPDKVMQPTV